MPGECGSFSCKVSLSSWNINGLVDSVVGDKTENRDFLNHVNKFDFIFLTETWTRESVFVPGFKCFVSKPQSKSSKGRLSGGIVLLYKNQFASFVTIGKTSSNLVWCKIDKILMGTKQHVYICGVYIPPENSKYFSPQIFEDLENDIVHYRSEGYVILTGDFNSRTGKCNDYTSISGDQFIKPNESEEYSTPLIRNSCDNMINNHGKTLIEFCKLFDFRILNGRTRGDSLGNFTFHGKNGSSTVDYIICDQNLFDKCVSFVVKQPTYLSDHSQIGAWFSTPRIPHSSELEKDKTNPKLEQLPTQFIWSESSPVLFKNELKSTCVMKQVNDFLTQDFEETESGLNSAVSKVESILLNAAKSSLQRKTLKRRCKLVKHVNKKWFDKECRMKRHDLRKIANLKRRDPLNLKIREEFHLILAEYKNLLRRKKQDFKNEKLDQLSSTDVNSQTFWKAFQTLPDTEHKTAPPPIDEHNWLRHFGKLHSEPNSYSHKQQLIINDLRLLETRKDELKKLDYSITETEMEQTVKRLKYKKAASVDLVKNEMIKASYEILSIVYLRLFNLIIKAGIYPSVWCFGLITPIFKSGDKQDPGNYRGICVSSCLGKFFSSILNQRLFKFAESKKLIHPSQIGFLQANRTSDHIFTLRALIEKYSHCHKQKIYACFVDFRKAFDSVWHEGLFHRILSYGIGGKFYDLLKSLYSRSTCAIKLGPNKTNTFSYRRGVRQGCILSPLLFNLFVNELPLSLNQNGTDPFILPNGNKLNSLLYADDLVILSKSKQGLDKCLRILECFNTKWLLNINYKKTKIIIFYKTGRKQKNLSFHIDNTPIEIVQEYTYLGITISSSGTFTIAQSLKCYLQNTKTH